MKLSRTAALVIAGLGLALVIAGPLLPGGERLIRDSPPEVGHVTSLALAEDGAVLAGTQDGELWRRGLGTTGWLRVQVRLGEVPVTALAADIAGDPARGPIGTAGGLVNGPTGLPPVSVRISDDAPTRNGLVLGTGDGLLIAGAGDWQTALAGVQVYRIEASAHAGTDWLHVGSVSRGVFSAQVDDLQDWQPNSEGLHAEANVFAFAVTASEALVAGTDRGLYWQPAPLAPWQPLKVGLDQTRILALHLDAPLGDQPPGAAGDGDALRQRLWLGTDAGLYRVALVSAADGALTAQAFAEQLKLPPGRIGYGISYILPHGDDGVVFSAGNVYRYGPMGLAGWYWISLGGVVLVLIGGMLLPGRGKG